MDVEAFVDDTCNAKGLPGTLERVLTSAEGASIISGYIIQE
jgi:hypothetical protein